MDYAADFEKWHKKDLAADMRRFIRETDDTRPITCGISITQNIDEYQGKASAKEQHMGGIGFDKPYPYLTGAGSLQGLGSGAAFTEDSFVKGECHTFYGRALAVVRAGYEPGEIRVKICCGDMTEAAVLECAE